MLQMLYLLSMLQEWYMLNEVLVTAEGFIA